jgi:hypothetical protein
MPPLEAFGPSIAIGLILFVMLWFALGTQRNIRIGNDLLRWLQGGLPLLGRRTTLRWLGSSAVELRMVEPAEPFREAAVLAVLEPRDVSLLWAYARWRGRRDFLIVRVSLVRAPPFSMEVRDPRGWTGRDEPRDHAAIGGGGEDGWRRVEWPGGQVAVAGPGANEAGIRSAWEAISAASAGVWKLTVQPVVPHLEVHLRPPADRAVGADALLAPIRQLAATLAQR